MAQTSDGRTYLKLEQSIKLSDWLRKHKQDLLSNRPSFHDVAEQAVKELGFPISAGNLRTAAKASSCLWLPKKKVKAASKARQSYKALAIYVEVLYKLVGLDPPLGLQGIKNGVVPETLFCQNDIEKYKHTLKKEDLELLNR